VAGSSPTSSTNGVFFNVANAFGLPSQGLQALFDNQ
jgi:hypothetical protein